MRHDFLVLEASICLVIVLMATPVLGQPDEKTAPVVGPENGSLILVGGGRVPDEVLQRFFDLAGGLDAPVLVIPTAGGGSEYGPYWRGLRSFKRFGATNLTMLHTYDRKEADSDAFVSVLKKARGVWFSGGRQWRLVDAYMGTKVEKELWALLERGGVIGGTSAGATIQGSYLTRGDTKTNTIMMGDHEKGLAFLRNVAVDQHVMARNRQFDLIEIIEAHPHLLGLGIDESTAIVVRGDEFEVIGESYVAVYDQRRTLDSGGLFYFLRPGDQYDLKTRTPYRPTTSREPLGRVEARPWPTDSTFNRP